MMDNDGGRATKTALLMMVSEAEVDTWRALTRKTLDDCQGDTDLAQRWLARRLKAALRMRGPVITDDFYRKELDLAMDRVSYTYLAQVLISACVDTAGAH